MGKVSLLPQRLKELRLQHGLTQAQLGEKVGVKQNTFTNWENGKRTPSLEDIWIGPVSLRLDYHPYRLKCHQP